MLQLCQTSGAFKFYTSSVINGSTTEYSLDIDSTTAFQANMFSKLQQPASMVIVDAAVNFKQGMYCAFNASTLKDGHVFKGKKQSLTMPPKDTGGIRISLYLIPECSAYIGGHCAIAVDVFIDVYKLLGGRSFCTDGSLYWIKGDTTKLGLQLQISTLLYTPYGGYNKVQADFMRSPYNKIEAIKLLHMTLASYSYVDNLLKTSDDLCSELATLIYQDAVLPWKSDAPASSIDSIKSEWLGAHLLL